MTIKRMLLSLAVFTITFTSLIATPQAIVFDFGGVLTGEPNREAVIAFIQKSFLLSKEEFEKINQEKHQAIKQGKTDEEFWISYAEREGIELPSNWTKSFRSVMKDAIGVCPEMYVLVDQLKEREIPVALLSNVDDRFAGLIRSFGFYEPFSPCLLSCDIGMRKPDPEIYEFLLQELDLPAQEIVFIDDKIANVEAAKKMGIDAILFGSEQQLRSELSKRGIFERAARH